MVHPRSGVRNTALRWLTARRDQRGATAVEYALMMAFIVAVILGGVTALGLATLQLFLRGVASFP